MQSISVFCGSNEGFNSIYRDEASRLGSVLAQKGITLVYGGSSAGLMGAVADGALSHGGKVIGILPRLFKEKEIAHENLTELIWVDTMHQRKMKMHDLSDAAIALPGGYGTMDEFFELLTMGQIGLHKKPVGMLNVSGFYDPLLDMTKKMVQQGFLEQKNREMLIIRSSINGLLSEMNTFCGRA